MKRLVSFTKPFRSHKPGDEVLFSSAHAKVVVEVLGKGRYLDKSLKASPVIKQSTPIVPPPPPLIPEAPVVKPEENIRETITMPTKPVVSPPPPIPSFGETDNKGNGHKGNSKHSQKPGKND